MADLNLNDIIQQYNGCLIFYKGKPHKVKRCADVITLLDVATQRTKLVEFSLKDFSAPFLRLGYLNVDNTATFIARKSVRMMNVGLNLNNCEFQSHPPAEGIDHKLEMKIYDMECVEYGDMFFNHYPSLEEARKKAQKLAGSVAFDKQFCIDYNDRIYYKGGHVGAYSGKQIEWKAGKNYLSTVLGEYDEKNLRTFSKEAA